METHAGHTRGLSSREAEESRARHGANLLTPPPRTPWWKLFLEKFTDPVIRILLIAAFLSLGIAFAEGGYAETIGIFCAVILSTGIAFWFEYDAQRKFDLHGTVDNDILYKVYRDGALREVPKRDIVVGDAVVIETGEEVPADGRLAEAVSLSVNESNLTGEPVASKTADPARFDAEATYPSDMLMRGTTIVEGHGTFTVTAVGDRTEYGKVARQSALESDEKTPLTRQLEKLAKFIGVIGFGLAFLTFIALFLKDVFRPGAAYTFGQLWLLGAVLAGAAALLVKVWVPIVHDGFELIGKPRPLPRPVKAWGWWVWIGLGIAVFGVLAGLGYLFWGIDPLRAQTWVSMETARAILGYFMVAVTLIVVAVPEGLPMSVTLSLALSMRRMLKSNNLVRKMHACETMGAATVICTDKTGTLTRNQMSVAETAFYALSGDRSGHGPADDLIREGMAVNSTAFLEKEDGKVKPVGNPTEGALLLWLEEQGTDYAALRDGAETLDQLSFSTERKYMATLVRKRHGNRLYVKGAPEIVFTRCRTVLTAVGEKSAETFRQTVETQLAGYQRQAMRTLGFGYWDVAASGVTGEEAMKTGSLVFLGIAAIMDPVREDVPQAVARCLSAGIAVKIVTGDTPGTAIEIARRIGLWTEGDDERNHLTGAEFGNLTDEELLARVGDLKVMSRARPTDKQRLVQLLQRRGEVVAVTGDGTNDAPALNFAHVGLSMGTGTAVAKEASDITLLDDSFNSIATAVMWGRSLYRNIQRFIVFQLTINVTALVIVFFGSLFGAALPLTVTQMLWVNLIMDTFAAGALASLPPDPKVMLDKPRPSGQFIITPPMARRILGTAALFVAVLSGLLLWFGPGITLYQLSAFFTVFVMLQFWNLFNARVFGTRESAFRGLGKTPAFLSVLALILIGQIVIVTWAGSIFRTRPLTLPDWLLIVCATGVGVLLTGEIARWWRRSSR